MFWEFGFLSFSWEGFFMLLFSRNTVKGLRKNSKKESTHHHTKTGRL